MAGWHFGVGLNKKQTVKQKTMSIEHDENEAEIQPYPLRLPSRESRETMATTWPARDGRVYCDASDRNEWADYVRNKEEVK